MEKKIYVCENCKKIAENEKQLRKENWLELHGGATQGISIWLKNPRKHIKDVTDSFMLTIGWQGRDYHFCSIKCLVALLKGNESI
jgi:hypothetical protein